jgi:hypothetical protein
LTDLLLAGLVAVGLLAVGAASWSRTRRRPETGTVVPSDLGPFPTVLFFSSGSCASCPPARQVVAAATADRFKEYSWDAHPGILRRLRIEQVPTTWVVDAEGRVVDRVEGPPDEARFRRSLAALTD